MSDETFEYITTDYLIQIDSEDASEPTIEYIVELGEQGLPGIPGEKGEPGFSPSVDYVLNNNTFNISIVNQDGVIQTPNLYDYFADKNGYLKIDGSNADNSITINNISLRGYTGGIGKISTTGTLQLHGSNTNIYGTSVGIDVKANSIDLGNWTNGKYLEADTTVKYGTSSTKYEIATVNDIGNGTITLTQGGVTKGTFTTNQSGNATINLDAGGGAVTNPIVITNQAENRTLSLGIDDDTNKVIFNYNIGGFIDVPIPLLYSATSPLVLTERSADGLYTLSLDYDTNTLGLDANNKLTVIGGGGTTYTAGTGIDITSDVISIDTDVVALLSDIPDTSDMATQTWVGNQGYLTGITSSDVTSALGYTPLQSSDLSNYVTINTAQTISSSKAFSSVLVVADNQGLATGTILSNKKILQRTTGGAITLGHTADELQLIGSTTNPKYTKDGTNFSDIALKSDIPTNNNYVDLTTAQTISGSKTFSSETHHTGVITFDSAMLNPIIRGMSGSSYRNMIYRMGNDSAIIVGNSNDTIDLKGSGTRPTYNSNNLALYSDIPTDYVTLTTNQTSSGNRITGNKQFIGTVYLTGDKTILQNNNNSANLGYLGGTTDFEINTYSNKNINLKPNGTGEVQYNGNKVATINDIPSISNLADKDLSNITATGKNLISDLAMPSDNVTIITNMAANTPYQVSKSGYIGLALQKSADSNPATAYLHNMLDNSGNNELVVYAESSQWSTWMTVFMPVRAGQWVRYDYTGTIVNTLIRFIECEGEQ